MKTSQNKTSSFIKRNAIYLVMALCIMAIGFSIIYMFVPENESLDNSPDVEVNTPVGPTEDEKDDQVPTIKPTTFILPIQSPTAIGEYSDTVVWSSTLSRYSSHTAIDFFAPEGTDVLAVMDGTIEKVENSLLKGYSVTIDHGNGLKTVYNSLADGDMVVEGQVVKAGDVIGQVSVTNRQEYKDGAHLHFEAIEGGKYIDPEKYMDIGNK